MKSPDTTLIGSFHDPRGIFYDYFVDELVVWRGTIRVARFQVNSRDMMALGEKLMRLSLELDEYRLAKQKKKSADEAASK